MLTGGFQPPIRIVRGILHGTRSVDLAGDKQNFLFNVLSAIQLPSDSILEGVRVSHPTRHSAGCPASGLQRMRDYVDAHLADRFTLLHVPNSTVSGTTPSYRIPIRQIERLFPDEP